MTRQIRDELVVLPALRATSRPHGHVLLTRKYLEGTSEFSRHWPGEVTSLVEATDSVSTDFDHVEVDLAANDIGIELRPGTTEALLERLDRAAVVLAFLSRRDAPLAPLCKARGIPLVYVTEYSYETLLQIMRAEVSSPLVRLRRHAWLARTERIIRRAARGSAGLQCSGVPTFDNYGVLHPHSMTFFDNRIREDGVIAAADCAAKAADLASGRPLQLVFGGRFSPMKGVMALPDVAAHLKRRGVAFTFDVYGAGPQQEALAARIDALGLGECMQIRKPVDFRSEWVENLKRNVDLFVCPHPQGDPSSTYPEVMACGVPIVGFANAAFRGIVETSGCGWLTPLGDPGALAAEIARLDGNRAEISAMGLKGLPFAASTTFETTFKARIEHLIEASRLD